MNKTICNITVIIPTLNRPKTLINTIISINSLLSIPKEIIVIDQSDDDIFNQTSKMLNGSECCGQTIIHHHLKIKSSTISRNYGISISTQEIIVFCDDDVEFVNETFGELESIMSDKKISLIGGFNISDLNNNRITFRQRISSLFYLKPKNRINSGQVLRSCFGFIPITNTNDFYKTDWAMGFFFAVRKCVLLESNIRFDENLTKYAYGEDLDFSYRFCNYSSSKGYDNYYCKRITVKHLATLEYREHNSLMFLKVFINRRYLSNKLFGNNVLQHFRLEISNLAYLLSLKNNNLYCLYKEAYKVYKTKRRMIDKNVREISFYYE